MGNTWGTGRKAHLADSVFTTWRSVFCFVLMGLVATLAWAQDTPASDKAPDAVPPLDAQLLRPHQGEQAEKARQSLPTLIKSLDVPAFLKDTQVEPPKKSPDAQPDELPLSVQQAYIDGRTAWVEGRRFEAINHLQIAMNQAPNEPHIMRLLGRIYADYGNRVRGATYLEKAVALQPDDVESLFMLGRFAIDGSAWDQAVVLFDRVLAVPADDRIDPAIRLLSTYYLAAALERLGYDQAAVDVYAQHLNTPAKFNRTTRYMREVYGLSRQRGLTWQSMGDALHRLGKPEQALRAYEQAKTAGEVDQAGLAARMLHTLLQLKRDPQVRAFVLERLRAEPDESTIAQLRYVAGKVSDPAPLWQAVRKIYIDQNRSPSLAVLLGQTLDRDDAVDLLTGHLVQRPSDRQVFGTYISRQLEVQTAQSLTAALDVSAKLTAAQPQWAQQHVQSLVDAAADSQQLLSASRALVAQRPDDASLQMNHGLILMSLGDVEQAIAALEGSLEKQKGAPATSIALARLLVEQGQYERAQKLLSSLDEQTHESESLLVDIYLNTDRAHEALALLNKLTEQDPLNVELSLKKAALQWHALNEPVAAERTLLDALNRQPQEEKFYEALLRIYNADEVPDTTRQYQRLMRRLFATIPQSRLARLERARLLMHNNPRVSEQLLRGLLLEDDQDFEAMWALLELLANTEREAEAMQMLNERLTQQPDNAGLLMVAAGFYENRDKSKSLAYTERLIKLEPPGEKRSRNLAAFYFQNDQNEKAVEVLVAALDQPAEEPHILVAMLGEALARSGKEDAFDEHVKKALERFPEANTDIRYMWASFWEQRGQRERAQKMMVELLKERPDHGPTNNNLAYSWSNQGKHLDQSLEMVQIALKEDPENAAYLDTLGWIYYKLGRFEEAEQWLRRASKNDRSHSPVITDHLADTLYRLGRKKEALQAWQEAQRQLSQQKGEPDADTRQLMKILPLKIEIARTGRQKVPVAQAQVNQQPDKPEADQ